MKPLFSLLPAGKRKRFSPRLGQFAYTSSQTGDQPVASFESQFTCRYGYGRSAESASVGESGQDFAAVRINKSVCCFTLCDGVGLSYRGDFAARYLGTSLLDWLEKESHISDQGLDSYLQHLAVAASLELDQQPLAHMSDLLRSVLEEKKRQGSQSMYICGKIELPKRGGLGYISLIWQGDSRVRLWQGSQEVTDMFENTFSTAERWSTSQGPIGGKPHRIQTRFKIGTPMRLQMYTDGLSDLDPISHFVPDQHIQTLLDAPHTNGLEDDAAFIELQW